MVVAYKEQTVEPINISLPNGKLKRKL